MKYEEAIKTLDKIIKIYYNNHHLISNICKLRLIVALNNRGICYIKLGKFDKAISSFVEFFDRDPNIDFHFIMKIAMFLVHIKREIEALAVYNKILGKDSIEFLDKKKGDFLVKIGRNNEALAVYDKAIEAYDKALEAYDKALEAYDKAIEKNPRFLITRIK